MFIAQKKKWSDAQAKCRSLGGFVAEPSTEDENDFLKKIMSNHSQIRMWIGGNDQTKNDQWMWVNAGTLVNNGYTDWAPGQPDDAWTDEYCMELIQWKHGSNELRWNDGRCWWEHSFVCQKSVTRMGGAGQ